MVFFKSKLFHCAVFVSLVYTPWAFSVKDCANGFPSILLRNVEYLEFSPGLETILKANNLFRIGDLVRLTEH